MGNLRASGHNQLTQGLKVLIVESDPAMLFLFQQVLMTSGFTVLSTRLGKEAYRLVCTESPDAILLNIFLPDIGGFDLLAKLKASQTSKPIPILATTAHWSDYGESFFINHGFDGIIKQPIDLKSVGENIRHHIGSLQTRSAQASQRLHLS